MRILKWSVISDGQTYFIGEGPVVFVNCQFTNDEVQVWTVEDDADAMVEQTRRVMVVETGQTWPSSWRHLGSVVPRPDLVGAVKPRQQGDLTVVWHVVGEGR